MTYVIGIDPGATGALALYDTKIAKIIDLKDMPNYQEVLTTGKKTNRVNFNALRYILEDWKQLAISQDKDLFVHIEKVNAFSKQSAPAAFNFGYAAAIPLVICKMLDLYTIRIPAVTWKGQFGLKAKDKDEARQLALKLFPYLGLYLKRKMDVDRADAILIAVYKPRI